MYQYTTFKYCFGFILVLPSQDQFQKLYLKRTMEDLQQRGSHMKEDRTLQKQSAEVSTDQENYLASQGAIAEKPLKKKGSHKQGLTVPNTPQKKFSLSIL